MPIGGGYKIYLSLYQPGIGSGTAVLFRRGLDLWIKTIFLNPEDKLVALDVSGNERGAFRLVAVYATAGRG